MKVVIVGNGPASASAIEAFRSVDKDSEIVVLSDEEFPTYAPNCMENVIRDDISEKALFYKGGYAFYEKHRVDFRPKKEVVKINNKRNVVITKDGEEIRYDKCLLAAGAYAFVPPIEGVKLKGITTAKTLKDAIQIRDAIKEGKVKKAVIVGAGPIGIEDAETLHHLGIKVSVVEIFDRVLPRMLDQEMGKIYGDTLKEETGIDVYLEHQVVAFHGKDRVEAVEIKRKDSDKSIFIEADLVIMSTGVRPRTYLVEGTDIKVHMDKEEKRQIGGILVDRYQRTSDPNVYACGDIASGIDVWGNHRWIALFPPAQQSGYIAGFNMAGRKVINPGLVDYNAVKTRTVTAGSAGIFENAEDVIKVEKDNYIVKVFIRDGRIVGYQFVGVPRYPSLNPNNRILRAMKIDSWAKGVLYDRGFGLETSGVLFHNFLKLKRRLNEISRRAVEEMIIRALGNPSIEVPLFVHED